MDALGYEKAMAAPAVGGMIEALGCDLPRDVAALRAVIRGEEPLDHIGRDDLKTLSRAMHIADLAQGIVTLKADHRALAEWARFILVHCEPAAFAGALTDYGSRLIGCLWTLAFVSPPAAPSILLAQAVHHRFAAA